MDKNAVIRQQHLPLYPSFDQTTDAVNVKRPRPSAQLYYSICKTGQLTSFATLPYQQINRYAVVGEVAIRFYLIILKKYRILSRIHVTNFSYTSFALLKNVWLLIPNSHTIRCKWILNVRKYSYQSDEGLSNIWCRRQSSPGNSTKSANSYKQIHSSLSFPTTLNLVTNLYK